MGNKSLRFAALAALIFALALGFGAHSGNAQPPQAAGLPAAGKLPDVLGITTGMLAQQALDIMRAHDVAHSVDFVRITIPQLYGNRPIMSSMNTPYGETDQIWVTLTMPPLEQRVYTVRRSVHVTAWNAALRSELLQKYGARVWDQFLRPIDPQNAGGFLWLFDETGQVVDPGSTPMDRARMENCLQSTGEIWVTGQPAANTVRYDAIPGGQRTAVVPTNPVLDPAVHHMCDNLVVVTAGGGPNNTMEVNITDVTLQHRAAKVWNDQLNAIVQKGSQQQRNNASQQALPQF